ncbi:MAG TPA: hypothetical protein VKZ79_09635 [Alphaproteobacteria bacterium]|nr:hypothetical protein [Alphaproteobacteria bacterium]
MFCLLPLAAAEASADGPPAHAQMGDWQILSVAEAGSRRLDYCAVEAAFEDGLVLTIERDRGGRSVIVLQTRAPSFAAGARYDVRIAMEGGAAIASTGRASDANSLAIPLESHTGTASALARGRRLSIMLPREIILFAPNGIDRAIGDLERCFANAVESKARSADSLVERVLDQAQSGAIQVARPAGSSRDEDREYAWSQGPVSGGAREIAIAGDATFLDLVLTRLDRLVSRCHGHFAPELDPPRETASGVIETGIATCSGTEGDRVAAFVYFKRGTRFGEFMLEAPDGTRAAALADRDNIVKIVRMVVLDY